jgi:hypothetical protein
MPDDVRYDLGGWLSGSMLGEAQILRELQRRHPDYAIGREIGHRQRFYAYRRRGSGVHSLITDDLGELVTELERSDI